MENNKLSFGSKGSSKRKIVIIVLGVIGLFVINFYVFSVFIPSTTIGWAVTHANLSLKALNTMQKIDHAKGNDGVTNAVNAFTTVK